MIHSLRAQQNISYISLVSLRLTVGLLFSLCSLCFSGTVSAGNTAGADIAYRVSLYDYFQKNYFSALATLLIEQEKESPSAVNSPSDLLSGGIYVSYGMDQPAMQLLRSLEKTEASPENRARAAFYLGKLFYRKGQSTAASEQFSKVDNSLSRELSGEFHYLMNTSRYQSESNGSNTPQVNKINRFSKESIWWYYNQFNHYVSVLTQDCADNKSPDDCARLMNQEGVDAATQGLSTLLYEINNSSLIDHSDELLALRDKTYTTLGFIFLENARNREAIDAFKKVRESSPFVGRALLGYGWAASNENDMKVALTPWQQLAGRPVFEASTKEGLLALPYVYEQLNVFDQALLSYNNADLLLQQEVALLSRVKNLIIKNEHYDFSHYLNNAALQWLNYRRLPDIKKSPFKNDEQAYQRLQEFQSDRRYVALSQQLADVGWLKQRLQQWRRDAEVIRFAIVERQRRAQQLINPEHTATLQQRYSQIRTRQTALVADSGSEVLLSSAEIKLQQRITRATDRVKKIRSQLKKNEFSDTQMDQLRANDESLAADVKLLNLMNGTLQWQAAQQSSARRRQHQIFIHDIERELVDANNALQDIADLEIDAVAQADKSARLELLSEKLEQQLAYANKLQANFQQHLREFFVEEIDRQLAQTRLYLAQAQMARARLMDTLSLDGSSPLSSNTNQGKHESGAASATISQVSP